MIHISLGKGKATTHMKLERLKGPCFLHLILAATFVAFRSHFGKVYAFIICRSIIGISESMIGICPIKTCGDRTHPPPRRRRATSGWSSSATVTWTTLIQHPPKPSTLPNAPNHPSIHLIIPPFLHQSVNPSIRPSPHLSIHASIYPCIHPSINPSIHLSNLMRLPSWV